MDGDEVIHTMYKDINLPGGRTVTNLPAFTPDVPGKEEEPAQGPNWLSVEQEDTEVADMGMADQGSNDMYQGDQVWGDQGSYGQPPVLWRKFDRWLGP